MRHLIVCNGSDEAAVIGKVIQGSVKETDRFVILSSRRGSAWESGSILSVPLRWSLKYCASPYWRQQDLARKAITLIAGLRGARYFGGLEDLLMQIEACDPDVLDLRELGVFGERLKPRCASRFPGRTVIAANEECALDENLASWRTYDPAAFVSIVLPTFNSERYLGLAIESCLRQTHDNFELIIVDDDSTDDTPNIIKAYSTLDPRIRHIVRKGVGRGLPEALNVGFDCAKGRFLTWFQSDNIYTSRAIEYMVQQLCTFTKVGLVYCSTHRIDEAGKPAIPFYFRPTLPPVALARSTVINGPFMYRREVMESVGPYRPECRYFEDLDFFIRAAAKFPGKFYVEPCHFYRRHSGSLTTAHSDGGRNWEVWARQMRIEHFVSGRNRVMLPTAEQLVPVRRVAETNFVTSPTFRTLSQFE
jgi:Glycosyl transferase family 2